MKRIALVLMLLAMLFALSGCVTDINTAGDVTYDAATDTLTIPLRFGFFDTNDGKAIGYDTDQNEFTEDSDTHDLWSLNDVVVYYATTEAGIDELERENDPQGYSADIKQKSLSEIIFTDNKANKRVSVNQGMTLPAYDAKTDSVEYKLEVDDGREFHNGYLNMSMGISNLKLEDGQKVCARVYIQTKYNSNPEITEEKLSNPIHYQYFEPVVPDVPQTGDASSMLPYVLLLSTSALALCVMNLRRRKA